MSNNSYNPRLTDWGVTFNSFGMGQVNKVDPSKLKIELEPIKRGSTGGHTLGHYVKALSGILTVEAKDITPALIDALCAWKSGSGNSTAYPLIPMGMNTNLYQYAQALVLHPLDKGDASEDLTLIKALCINPPNNMARDGVKDDVWPLDFIFYPDLAKITASPPVISYGYVGLVNPAP